MRPLLATLLLVLTAVGGLAGTYPLRGHGRLALYPVGEWNVVYEDTGEILIQILPKNPDINAAASLTIVLSEEDKYPTPGRLTLRLQEIGRRLLLRGRFVETEPAIRPFYCKTGYGYYFMLTDPLLIGKPPVPNDYKKICLGLIRLDASVLVSARILSDGEETESFQQLLGMIEGLELVAR